MRRGAKAIVVAVLFVTMSGTAVAHSEDDLELPRASATDEMNLNLWALWVGSLFNPELGFPFAARPPDTLVLELPDTVSETITDEIESVIVIGGRRLDDDPPESIPGESILDEIESGQSDDAVYARRLLEMFLELMVRPGPEAVGFFQPGEGTLFFDGSGYVKVDPFPDEWIPTATPDNDFTIDDHDEWAERVSDEAGNDPPPADTGSDEGPTAEQLRSAALLFDWPVTFTKTSTIIPAPFGELDDGVQYMITLEVEGVCDDQGNCLQESHAHVDTFFYDLSEPLVDGVWELVDGRWHIIMDGYYVSAEYPDGTSCIYAWNEEWDIEVTDAVANGESWLATAFTGTMIRSEALDLARSVGSCPAYEAIAEWSVDASRSIAPTP